MLPAFDRLKTTVLDVHRGFGCGPDSRFGIHLDVANAAEAIVADWTPDARHEGPPGTVHGGVQAIVADAMAGWASTVAQARLGEKTLRFPVTTHLDMRFRAPLPVLRPLHLSAQTTGVQGRDIPCLVQLGTAEEPRCTVGRITYRLLEAPWCDNPYAASTGSPVAGR